MLSGYLITSVITAGHHAGNFSLRKFYQRRIARLFPAFLAMAIASMVAALFIYSAQDLASTGESQAAAPKKQFRSWMRKAAFSTIIAATSPTEGHNK